MLSSKKKKKSCSGTLRDQTTCLRISRKRPISVFNPLDYFSHQKARDAHPLCNLPTKASCSTPTNSLPIERPICKKPHLEPRGCINSAKQLDSGSWSLLHKKVQGTTVSISSSLLTKTWLFQLSSREQPTTRCRRILPIHELS